VPQELQYLTGPLVGLVGIAVLLACRWATEPARRRRSAAGDRGFGLLLPAAVLPDEASAERVRARLATHGIRGTVAAVGPGFYADGRPLPGTARQVLVFPRDLPESRRVLGRR
jgi:hypothetical protein